MGNKIYDAFKLGLFTTIVILAFMIILPAIALKSNASVGSKDTVINDGVVKDNEPKDILLKSTHTVKVYITAEDRIEEVDLEDYICGVVSNEMPASFDTEALKAQAVAARTFWASKLQSKCDKGDGADVCDTTHCQVYTSKEKRMGKWEEASREANWNKIKDAVYATKGMVLSYDDKLVLYPQYFATSSGKTESAIDAYWADVPYLKSVDSKGEEIAPKFTSEKSIAISDFVSTINEKYPECNLTENNVESSINIISRSDAGGIKQIKLGKETLKGPDFRFLIGLNSTNFTYKFSNGDIVFDCKGYGHGVGMSQWGANVMGKSGKKYDEILKHYYTGVQIANIKFDK